MSFRNYIGLTLLFALGLPAAARTADDGFFETKIRPVLAGTCFQCHGAKKVSGGLRLDSRQAMLDGGDSGPALIPGDAERSLMIQALRHEDNVPHMPPKKRLPPQVVADFTAWVRAGAPWPDTTSPRRAAEASSRHWAFQSLQMVQPPLAGEDDGNPLDSFLTAKQREKSLRPLGRADRRTLLRRAAFDLTGMPPSPDEMDAFLADDSPSAFIRAIDRLLASPHYGERWGRHWLDVVRYADTAGETADYPVADAWRYRNYVLDAFNRDKPYHEFLREQIAGDLLAAQLPANAAPQRRRELVVATGFISIARRFGFDPLKDHNLTIDDTLDTLGKSVLGLALGCARCHDHKYDPIAARDYFALYGIFDSTRYPFPGSEKDKRPRDLVPLFPSAATPEQAYAVADGSPHNVRLHKRGDPDSPGAEVPRRFLQVFGGQLVSADAGSGRLQLADWLTEACQPLTARVMVNRIWQGHFGVGLVKTANDFGTRGEPPTHPELLDYLARRFIESGWSLKAMHRLIMSSAAYQRSSAQDDHSAERDPDNALLGRFARRRLSAEEIRDAMLTASGDLDASPGGPHPFPKLDKWEFTQHRPFLAVYDHNRRSVYLMTQRIKRHPFLALFDGADTSSSTGGRYTTTVPTQALFFLNDPFVHERAAHLAQALLKLPDDRSRLERAAQLLYSRPAWEREWTLAERFLTTQRMEKKDDAAAWSAWLRAMLCSNEFLYVD